MFTINTIDDYENIPKKTKNLIFGKYFNQDIEKKFIPQSVICIKFDKDSQFNDIIKPGSLPVNLKELHLDSTLYNNPIEKKTLPSNLTHLNLGSAFDQELKPGVLPDSLEYLSMPNYTHILKKGVIPPKIKDLKLTYYNHPITEGVLPDELEVLKLINFNNTIEELPWSVTELYFGDKFNQPIDHILQNSNLKYLTLGDDFNQPLDFVPESLTELSINIYRHEIDLSNIPKNVYMHKQDDDYC